MGLIKTNYELKETGIIVPRAYAAIQKLSINKNFGIATFVVSSTRDNALNKKPLEEVEVAFEVDRNENPYITAYNKAKSIRTELVTRYNKDLDALESVSVDQPEPFFGWEDDIIGE